MDSKKGKALALELIDDLLNEEEDQTQEPIKRDNVDDPSAGESPPGEETSASLSLDDEWSVEDLEEIEVIEPSLKQTPGTTTKALDPEATVPMPKSELFGADDSSRIKDDDDDQMKSTVGRFTGRFGGGVMGGTEAVLVQSENLHVAQQKILDLEKELERLRLENEQLGAAGETLRRKADELFARADRAQKKYDEACEDYQEEKERFNQALESKDKENRELRIKLDELEMRLSTNIQKIRVRERELENRLELVKMEGAALVRSKDEIILDLKRQLDQLNLELDNYRNKGVELNRYLDEKQDLLRRTVKALRLALSMLEGSEQNQPPLKKAK